MKRKIAFSLILLPCISVGMCFCGCFHLQNNHNQETQVFIEGDDTLSVGQQEQYAVDLDNKDITTYWTVDNPDIAEVTENGKLTAKAPGEVMLSAYANDIFAINKSITIADAPEPREIVVSGPEYIYAEVGTNIYHAEVYPQDASQEVEWSVDNPNAHITQDGVLTVSAGIRYVNVQATSKVNPDVYGKMYVQVAVPEPPVSLFVNGFKEVYVGASSQYTVSALPSTACNASIFIFPETTQYELADLDPITGLLNPKKKGEVDVIAVSRVDQNVQSQPYHVVINDEYPEVEKFEITGPDSMPFHASTLFRGWAYPLIPYMDVTWSVDEPSIWIHEQSRGQADDVVLEPSADFIGTIHLKMQSKVKPDLYAVKEIHVTNIPNSIQITGPADDELIYGEKFDYESTVAPVGTEEKVIWSIEDPNVASINPETGELVALNEGKTNVIATSITDETVQGIKPLSVVYKARNLRIIGPNKVNHEANGSAKYSATVEPNTVSQEVEWSVSPETVATIDADGLLITKAPGHAFVKATTKITPFIQETMKIDVVTNPTKITISGPKAVCLNQEETYSIQTAPELSIRDAKWSVNDSTVATINEDDGTLTPLKPGKVTITAKAKYARNVSDSLEVEVYDEFTKVWLADTVGYGYTMETYDPAIPGKDYKVRFVSSTYEIEEGISMPVHKQLKKSDLEVIVNESNHINDCSLSENILTIPGNFMGHNSVEIRLLGAEISEWITWSIIREIADNDLNGTGPTSDTLFEVGDYKTMWNGTTDLGYARIIDFHHDEYDEEDSEHVIIIKQAPFTFQMVTPKDLYCYSDAQMRGDDLFILPEWQTEECYLHFYGLDYKLWNDKYHLPVRMVNKDETYRHQNDDSEPELDAQSLLFVPSYTELTGYPQFKLSDEKVTYDMPDHSNPEASYSNDEDKIYAYYDESRYISSISLHTKLSRPDAGGDYKGYWLRNIQNITSTGTGPISYDYNYYVSYDGKKLHIGTNEDKEYKRLANWIFCI